MHTSCPSPTLSRGGHACLTKRLERGPGNDLFVRRISFWLFLGGRIGFWVCIEADHSRKQKVDFKRLNLDKVWFIVRISFDILVNCTNIEFTVYTKKRNQFFSCLATILGNHIYRIILLRSQLLCILQILCSLTLRLAKTTKEQEDCYSNNSRKHRRELCKRGESKPLQSRWGSEGHKPTVQRVSQIEMEEHTSLQYFCFICFISALRVSFTVLWDCNKWDRTQAALAEAQPASKRPKRVRRVQVWAYTWGTSASARSRLDIGSG